MLKLTRVLLVAGLMTAAAPSLWAQETKTETKTEPNAQPESSISVAKVKLLEPGAEPRKALRYAPNVGDATSITMRMKMASETEMNGQKVMKMTMPVTVMVIDIVIKEVRPNGDIAWDMTFTKAEVEPGEDANPMMVEGMRSAMKSMVGLKGSAVISNRGETKESSFDLAQNGNPMLKQLVDNATNTAGQLAAPLPEEAVGKGAKWEATSTIKNMGMSIDQTSTMTLKDLSEPAFTLDVAISQNAANQQLKMPGAPAGAKIELRKLTSSGTGVVKGSTSSIGPTDSNMKMTSKQDIALTIAGGPDDKPQLMSQHMDVEVTVTSAPTKAEPAKPDAPAIAPAKS